MSLLINQVIFILLNIVLAYYHSRLIKRNKKIYHGWWALGVALVIGAFALIDWRYVPVLTFLRLLVFPNALEKFRGLSFSYRSNSSTSIIDKLENKIFKTELAKTITYLVLLVASEILLITKIR